MTLKPHSRTSGPRVSRKCWPVEASRGKLTDRELYSEDTSVMNFRAESLPLLQDNVGNKGMEN